MIIDTHCHLDDESYLNDLDEVLNRAYLAGIKAFIIPGASKEDIKRAQYLSNKYENIYFAVGFHPYNIDEFNEEILKEYSSDPKCVAIGECGLDYYRLPEDNKEKERIKKTQKEIFKFHIEFAKNIKKPLIVHIRDASFDSKNILLELEAYKVGGVLHCFNADEQLFILAKHGFYFGIGGVVTFNNARKLVEILPKIPKDRLLFETDAPYLAPTPHRGKRNEPAFLEFIVKKCEEILGIPSSELSDISTQNAKKLFKLSL